MMGNSFSGIWMLKIILSRVQVKRYHTDATRKTLEKITDERLMPAARMIMKYKTAGYQERIVYK